MTHDNTQSDVVEAWDRLTGCANACGFPSIEAAIEHLADIHLASLSTKDSDGLEGIFAKAREELGEPDARKYPSDRQAARAALEILVWLEKRILTALTSSDAVLEERWQPIETAPKDGTEFQAWAGSYDGGWWEPKARINPESEAVEIWQRVDYDHNDWDAAGGVDWHITHWMPKPNGPAAIRKGDNA